MTDKIKLELEYVLKTSINVLENLLTTPSGLSKWFADDVFIKDDIYTFKWGNSLEKARLISLKKNKSIRWRWLHHETQDNAEDCYFELEYNLAPLTKDVILKVNVFNCDEEEDDIRMLWENDIEELRRVLGA